MRRYYSANCFFYSTFSHIPHAKLREIQIITAIEGKKERERKREREREKEGKKEWKKSPPYLDYLYPACWHNVATVTSANMFFFSFFSSCTVFVSCLCRIQIWPATGPSKQHRDTRTSGTVLLGPSSAYSFQSPLAYSINHMIDRKVVSWRNWRTGKMLRESAISEECTTSSFLFLKWWESIVG